MMPLRSIRTPYQKSPMADTCEVQNANKPQANMERKTSAQAPASAIRKAITEKGVRSAKTGNRCDKDQQRRHHDEQANTLVRQILRHVVIDGVQRA